MDLLDFGVNCAEMAQGIDLFFWNATTLCQSHTKYNRDISPIT